MSTTQDLHMSIFKRKGYPGFLGGSVVKNLAINVGDTGSIPDLEGSHRLQKSTWSLCSRA